MILIVVSQIKNLDKKECNFVVNQNFEKNNISNIIKPHPSPLLRGEGIEGIFKNIKYIRKIIIHQADFVKNRQKTDKINRIKYI